MNAASVNTPIKRSRIKDHAINFGLAAAMVGLLQLLTGNQSDYKTPQLAIIVHLTTVIPALLLGAWVLWRPKGTSVHRLTGRIWAALMLVTAIDSFWIRTLTGGISFIHWLSAVTLVSIPFAMWHARHGRIDAHLSSMRTAYISLCVAGLFAMMPGRIMGTLIFG